MTARITQNSKIQKKRTVSIITLILHTTRSNFSEQSRDHMEKTLLFLSKTVMFLMIFIYTRYWESPTEKVSKEKCQLTNYSNMSLTNVKSNYSGNNQRDEISYYHTLQKILIQPDDQCQVVTDSPCLFVLLHSLRQRVECCAWQKPCKRLDVLRKFRTCRPGEQNSPAVPDCSLQLHQTGPAVS